MLLTICQQEVQIECLIALALFFIWLFLIISDRCLRPSICSYVSDPWGPHVVTINHEVRRLDLLRGGNVGFVEPHVPQTHTRRFSSFKAGGACLGVSDCFSNCGSNFTSHYNRSKQSFISLMHKFWGNIVGFVSQMFYVSFGFVTNVIRITSWFIKLAISKVSGFILNTFVFFWSCAYFLLDGFFSLLLYVKGLCIFERTSIKEEFQPQPGRGRSRRVRSFEMKYGEIEDSFPIHHVDPHYSIQHGKLISSGKGSHNKQSHVFGSFIGGAGFQGHGHSQFSLGHHSEGYPLNDRMMDHKGAHPQYLNHETERMVPNHQGVSPQAGKYEQDQDSGFLAHHLDPQYGMQHGKLIAPGRGNNGKQSHIFGSFTGGAGFKGHGHSLLSFGHHRQEYPLDDRMMDHKGAQPQQVGNESGLPNHERVDPQAGKYGQVAHHLDPQHGIQNEKHNSPGNGTNGQHSQVYGSFTGEAGFQGLGHSQLSFGHHRQEHPLEDRSKDHKHSHPLRPINSPQDDDEARQLNHEHFPRYPSAEKLPHDVKQVHPLEEKTTSTTIDREPVDEPRNSSSEERDAPGNQGHAADPTKTFTENKSGKDFPPDIKTLNPKGHDLKSSASLEAGIGASFALSSELDLERQTEAQRRLRVLEKKTTNQKFIVN